MITLLSPVVILDPAWNPISTESSTELASSPVLCPRKVFLKPVNPNPDLYPINTCEDWIETVPPPASLPIITCSEKLPPTEPPFALVPISVLY